MMMISARSPKTSRRHVAKVAMSNAYDVSATGDVKQQSPQSDMNTSVSNANAFINESEYYEMDQGSTDHHYQSSKHNFEINSNVSEKNNHEDSGITMTGSASVSNQNFKSGGKLYKKHHHQLVHDSQSGVGFLPKPDTSTLIKNIDKKLQAADTIFIVSKHGRSKLVKKTPSKIKTNADLLADSTTNSLNNSNTSLNALTTLEQANNAGFVARKAARYFDQSESFDTFNENDYYTKSIGDVVGGGGGGGGKIYKSKFNSKSTVIFDESSSSMPSYGIGDSGKVGPDASFLRAKDLYRKYKEKVIYKNLL
jgi:hypothetical protein